MTAAPECTQPEGEHVAKYVEEPGLIDMYRCSCGWESKPYFDGAEYAYGEWRRHVIEASSLPRPNHGDAA